MRRYIAIIFILFSCFFITSCEPKDKCAHGHTPLDPVKEVIIESTCYSIGMYDMVSYCKYCNAEVTRESFESGLAEHTEEILPAVEATCDKEGLTEGKKCSVCNETLVKQEIVYMIEHNFEYNVVVVEPTCESFGFTRHECVCGNAMIDSRFDALNHFDNNADAICDRCDKDLLKFELSTDGTYYEVSDLYLNHEYVHYPECIDIPSTYKGLPVKIAKEGFYRFYRYKVITIEEGITEIPDSAFYEYSELEVINLPESITKIGENAFYGCKNLKEINLNDNIETIGSCAFYGCESLTSITIPEKISIIDGYTFRGCKSLKEINFNENLETIGESAFRGCESLTNIVIPDNVSLINDLAFAYCSSLVTASLPNSLDCVKYCIFENCTSLTSVIIPESVREIWGWAFRNANSLTNVYFGGTEEQWNSVEISDFNEPLINATVNYNYHQTEGLKYTLLEDGTYQVEIGNVKDEEIDIPLIHNGILVTAIKDYGFDYCTFIRSITIPNSITHIGKYAFDGCTSLVEVIIPESVTNIENYAFRNCTSLERAFLGDGITEISDGLFYDCALLSRVRISKNVKNIGLNAFFCRDSHALAYIYYSGKRDAWNDIAISAGNYLLDSATMISDYNPTKGLEYILLDDGTYSVKIGRAVDTEIIIPIVYKGVLVTRIESKAFDGCKKITRITLPNSITSIGSMVFNGCSGLLYINLPDSIETIESSFADCTSLTLTTLIVPKGITSLNHFFRGCNNLQSIVIQDGVKSMSLRSIFSTDTLTDIYYTGSKEEWEKIYKSDPAFFESLTIHYDYVIE